VTLLWSALSVGAIYALVAVGYNIVFISSGAFNFAQAQLVMLGAFVAYWGLTTLRAPVVVVFLLAGALVAAAAALEERVAIRPTRDIEAQLVTTVGVATLIEGATQLIWGAQPLQVPFFGPTGVARVLGGRVFPVDLVLIAVAIVVALGLAALSRTTLLGLALLAISEDREAAEVRGINVRLLALATFAFSGLVAGLLGPVIGPKTFAVATLGSALALKGFVALAMGGFGSMTGGLLGGLAVGVIESFTARYVGEAYSNTMVFAALLLVLLVRPAGLFGRARERVV
jgi:branched-chain amino acid transport system permease protein